MRDVTSFMRVATSRLGKLTRLVGKPKGLSYGGLKHMRTKRGWCRTLPTSEIIGDKRISKCEQRLTDGKYSAFTYPKQIF